MTLHKLARDKLAKQQLKRSSTMRSGMTITEILKESSEIERAQQRRCLAYEIEKLERATFTAIACSQIAKVTQHIGWLKQYLSNMTEDNWRDMKLRAERQLEELSAALKQD
jgi:ribosomal protein S6